MPNPKIIGEKSEAIIIAELVRRDYKVLIPFGDSSRYDLVIERTGSGTFTRIQCKTGKLVGGAIRFRTCSVRINSCGYKVSNYFGEIDMFAVYCPQLDKVYLVPIDKVETKTQAYLRVDHPRNNHSNSIRWAKDYELF